MLRCVHLSKRMLHRTNFRGYVPFYSEVGWSTLVFLSSDLQGCEILFDIFRSLGVRYLVHSRPEKDLAYGEIRTTVWRQKHISKRPVFHWVSRPRPITSKTITRFQYQYFQQSWKQSKTCHVCYPTHCLNFDRINLKASNPITRHVLSTVHETYFGNKMVYYFLSRPFVIILLFI